MLSGKADSFAKSVEADLVMLMHITWAFHADGVFDLCRLKKRDFDFLLGIGSMLSLVFAAISLAFLLADLGEKIGLRLPCP